MRKNYYFSRWQRYNTKGAERTIPFELRNILWTMVDALVVSKHQTDYLQVFELTCRDGSCLVKHIQEIPVIKNQFTVTILTRGFECERLKIFVIDDVSHCTMLLASEY
jgi:hypothetical protein